jgi:hypothetical protein
MQLKTSAIPFLYEEGGFFMHWKTKTTLQRFFCLRDESIVLVRIRNMGFVKSFGLVFFKIEMKLFDCFLTTLRYLEGSESCKSGIYSP